MQLAGLGLDSWGPCTVSVQMMQDKSVASGLLARNGPHLVARSGGQICWPDLVARPGVPIWWPDLVARPGHQIWWPGLVARPDGQIWWPELVARPGGQNWSDQSRNRQDLCKALTLLNDQTKTANGRRGQYNIRCTESAVNIDAHFKLKVIYHY